MNKDKFVTFPCDAFRVFISSGKEPQRLKFAFGQQYKVMDIKTVTFEDGREGDRTELVVSLKHPDVDSPIWFTFSAQLFGIVPIRVQRTRHSTPGIPFNSIYVGRPSWWGNPVKVGPVDARTAVFEFYEYCKARAISNPEQFRDWLLPLVDRNLCCWCSLDALCHADVLLIICRHLKPILRNPKFRTLIPQSVKGWPEISGIIA